MDELLLIIARAHQRDLQDQAARSLGAGVRWRRVRTGRATIVALPRSGAPSARAASSFDDAA